MEAHGFFYFVLSGQILYKLVVQRLKGFIKLGVFCLQINAHQVLDDVQQPFDFGLVAEQEFPRDINDQPGAYKRGDGYQQPFAGTAPDEADDK